MNASMLARPSAGFAGSHPVPSLGDLSPYPSTLPWLTKTERKLEDLGCKAYSLPSTAKKSLRVWERWQIYKSQVANRPLPGSMGRVPCCEPPMASGPWQRSILTCDRQIGYRYRSRKVPAVHGCTDERRRARMSNAKVLSLVEDLRECLTSHTPRVEAIHYRASGYWVDRTR